MMTREEMKGRDGWEREASITPLAGLVFLT